MQKPNKKLIKSFKKWLTAMLILLLLFIIQNSNSLLSFNNVKPILIFPFAIGFAMFSNQKNAAIFGIICGFFLDCFSERYFGISSLFLLVICVAISLICNHYVRIRFFNFIFLTTITIIMFESTNLLTFCLNSSFKNIWSIGSIWLEHNIQTAIFTIVISPIFYLISQKLHQVFDKKELISTN